jgi:hypothetical protein
VKGTIHGILSLSLLGLFVFSLRAANPDLSYAPPPLLSDAAWKELQRNHVGTKKVTLNATITAARGAVADVTVKEVSQLPRTSAEVQSWIKQHWKFVSAFTGTVVQPVSFQLVQRSAIPTATPAKTGSWGRADWALFRRAPKPLFPYQYRSEIVDYEERNHSYMPGVFLSITARDGAITDIRVIDQKGPTDLCAYTVNWIRQHWIPEPSVNKTFGFPVYYGIGH